MNLLPDSAPGRRDAVIRWGGTLLLALTFVGLAAMSWRKWPDLLIDFGIELYIPWRILAGKHLYLDIAWKHGPLSQYLNALWFRLFGVSISSLIFPNLAFLALLTWLIRDIFRRIVSPAAGLTASFAFLVLFGFSQYLATGNYNYVCPYRHEQAHGVILGVATLYCLLRTEEKRDPRWYFVTGIAFGLVFLTKIEATVAAAAAVGCGVGLSIRLDPEFRKRAVTRVALLVGGALVPPLVSIGLLSLRMPFGMAFKGTLGNWAYLFNSNLGTQSFYLGLSGLNMADRNSALMMVQFLVLGGVAVAGMLAEASSRWLSRGHQVARYGVAAIVAVGGYYWLEWFELPRAFPLILAFIATKTMVESFRYGQDPNLRGRLVGLVAWMVFALAMLAKMILATQIGHYGFTLAMPATLVLMVYAIHVIPARIRMTTETSGEFFQASMIGLTAAGLFVAFNLSREFYSYKDFSVGEGGDRIVTYGPRYSRVPNIVVSTLQGMNRIMAPGATLAVMPEGDTLNYFSRHPSSVPYTTYIPYDLATFGGEAATLETLKRNPPDYIAFVHRDLSEYGVGWFGADPKNGKLIMDWVVKEYRAAHLAGDVPLQRRAFGILLVQRRDLPPPPDLPAEKK